MKTDIEIAQGASMLPIDQVAAQAGIDGGLLEHYGRVKAKIDTTPLRSCPRIPPLPGRAKPPPAWAWRTR